MKSPNKILAKLQLAICRPRLQCNFLQHSENGKYNNSVVKIVLKEICLHITVLMLLIIAVAHNGCEPEDNCKLSKNLQIIYGVRVLTVLTYFFCFLRLPIRMFFDTEPEEIRFHAYCGIGAAILESAFLVLLMVLNIQHFLSEKTFVGGMAAFVSFYLFWLILYAVALSRTKPNDFGQMFVNVCEGAPACCNQDVNFA